MAAGDTTLGKDKTFDDLPEVLKQYYSPRQWSFLTDAQKANVLQQHCEPEWDEP